MAEKIRDDLYIQKGWDGYRVVYPNKKELSKPLFFRNPETKKFDNINWKNLIGQWHFWLKCFIFLLALYFFVQMYLSDTSTCREFIADIETHCIEYALSKFPVHLENNTFPNIKDVNITFYSNTIDNGTKETS